MNIFSEKIEKKIQTSVIKNVLQTRYDLAAKYISQIVQELHQNIPEKKRISYGIYSVIKDLGENLYNKFELKDIPSFENAGEIYKIGDDTENFRHKGVALRIISLAGLKNLRRALPYFRSAASSDYWDLREYASGFFRIIIKTHPEKAKKFLLGLTESPDLNLRRFVSETLRPVQENSWFSKNTEYPLSIIKNLFTESARYPRTSVGNNLSDHSRKNPQLIYKIVDDLVKSGDKNSYWIAYRACRNLVKSDPDKVMKLLGVDEYKYKTSIYKRSGKKIKLQNL
jgi:3-methyladenine DNA glycosylase AlkC